MFNALGEAAVTMDLCRLPELWCCFPCRRRTRPVLYPAACSPQPWASGSILLRLPAVLGLSLAATKRRTALKHARLPGFLEQLRLRIRQVAGLSVDLLP